MPNIIDKENLKSSNIKVFSYLQRVPHKTVIRTENILDWHTIFNVMKSKGLQQRLLYPAKLSQTRKKLKGFIINKPVLQENANKYISTTTLSPNGLSILIRRHTVAEWITKKTLHMLFIRDSLQIEGHAQTVSREMEKEISWKWKQTYVKLG